jgi:glycosyltransferase 2 family protein
LFLRFLLEVRKYIKFIFLILLTVIILWWFGKGLDRELVWGKVKAANWILICLAITLVSSTYLIRAYRWRTFLSPLTPVSLRETFAATTIGFSAVFLVGRAGEILRPTYLTLSDQRVKPASSFITIMIERIYDMTAVILLFSLNLLWFNPSADPTMLTQIRRTGAIMLTGALLGIISLIFYKKHFLKITTWLNKKVVNKNNLVGRIGRLVEHLLIQLAEALSVLVDKRELLITIGWSALLWGAIALANWLVLRAFGLNFGIGETIFVLGGALVGSLLPTPGGGAGGFHAATAEVLKLLGVHKDQAGAAVIILHLVVFAPALIFGIYYFFQSKVDFANLRDLVTGQTHEEVKE